MPALVLGATGMLGRALVAKLPTGTIGFGSTIVKLDRLKSGYLEDLLLTNKIDEIYMCAGKVGGIKANIDNQVDFFESNARMAINSISAAKNAGIQKFHYISSSCAYPENEPQPYRELGIYYGSPEHTNRGYAEAKRVGMKMCDLIRSETGWHYHSLIPCNLYGPGADFSGNGHVLASLVRKICDAKKNKLSEIEIWGNGTPRREMMHVDDAADAIILASSNEFTSNNCNINIGVGYDMTISYMAKLVCDAAGYQPTFKYNTEMPNGIAKKLLDVSYIRDVLGFKPKVEIEDGVRRMVDEYESIR